MSGVLDRLCTSGPVFTGRVVDLPLPVRGARQSVFGPRPRDLATVPEIAADLVNVMFERSRLTLRPDYVRHDTYAPTGGFGGIPYKVFVQRAREDLFGPDDSYGLAPHVVYILGRKGFYVGSGLVFTAPSPGGSVGGGSAESFFLPDVGSVSRRTVGVWASSTGLYLVFKSSSGTWGSLLVDEDGHFDAVIPRPLDRGTQGAKSVLGIMSGDAPPPKAPRPTPGLVTLITNVTATTPNVYSVVSPASHVVPKRIYGGGGVYFVVSSDSILVLRALPGSSSPMPVALDAVFEVPIFDERYFSTYREVVLGVVGRTVASLSRDGFQPLLDPSQVVYVPGDPQLFGLSSLLVSSGSDLVLGLAAFGYVLSSGAFSVVVQDLGKTFALLNWDNLPGVPAISEVDLAFYEFDLDSSSWLKVYVREGYYSSGVWDTGYLVFSAGKRVKLRSVVLYGDPGLGGCTVKSTIYGSDDAANAAEVQGPATYTWGDSGALQVPITIGPREWYRFKWEFTKTSNFESPPSVLFWRVDVESET
jgi:hypothetical protein